MLRPLRVAVHIDASPQSTYDKNIEMSVTCVNRHIRDLAKSSVFLVAFYAPS